MEGGVAASVGGPAEHGLSAADHVAPCELREYARAIINGGAYYLHPRATTQIFHYIADRVLDALASEEPLLILGDLI